MFSNCANATLEMYKHKSAYPLQDIKNFISRLLKSSAKSSKRLDENFFLMQLRTKKLGGARRDRTADLLRARQALSQLSYGPK